MCHLKQTESSACRSGGKQTEARNVLWLREDFTGTASLQSDTFAHKYESQLMPVTTDGDRTDLSRPDIKKTSDVNVKSTPSRSPSTPSERRRPLYKDSLLLVVSSSLPLCYQSPFLSVCVCVNSGGSIIWPLTASILSCCCLTNRRDAAWDGESSHLFTVILQLLSSTSVSGLCLWYRKRLRPSVCCGTAVCCQAT